MKFSQQAQFLRLAADYSDEWLEAATDDQIFEEIERLHKQLGRYIYKVTGKRPSQ